MSGASRVRSSTAASIFLGGGERFRLVEKGRKRIEASFKDGKRGAGHRKGHWGVSYEFCLAIKILGKDLGVKRWRGTDGSEKFSALRNDRQTPAQAGVPSFDFTPARNILCPVLGRYHIPLCGGPAACRWCLDFTSPSLDPRWAPAGRRSNRRLQ